MMGLHENIQLCFMIAGRTRCLVDGCFLLLKRWFCRSDVYTMSQLAEVFENSAACKHAQLIPGSGLQR